jgi:1-deoxy-D-xylulose-5-phosphate synthase
MLADAARHAVVVTVEDGVRIGGAGSAIAEQLAGHRVVQLGVPDAYIPQAKPERILADLGLDGQGIADAVQTALSALWRS